MPQNQQISKRAISLKPSLTLEISAKAKALKAKGVDICSLSAGEPDFETPSFIVEAAIKALKDGITRYGPAAGDIELREAIAYKQTNINKVDTDIKNVLITNGGKQAIYNLMQVLLNPNDEVLIPAPYWLSYPTITQLAGAKPIIINSNPKNGFKIDIDELETKITERTRLLILNSPGNPTGRIIPKLEMEYIASFLRKHPKILVLSDEIYEYLVDDGLIHYNLNNIAPDLTNRIFIVNGFAKAWAMTGWRIGYLVGNSEIIEKAIALQSQSTSNVCSFAQKGALAAITAPKDYINEMLTSYNKRRDILSSELNKIDGVSLIKPKGAFYAFPEIRKNNLDSIEFCKIALDKVGLAMVPGSAFGEDNCVRLSCAVSIETIKEGLERLENLLKIIK